MTKMVRAMPSSCMRRSTNPRQLLADQHVNDAPSAQHGAHGDAARLTVMDAADRP
jgi:hypothetical protein